MSGCAPSSASRQPGSSSEDLRVASSGSEFHERFVAIFESGFHRLYRYLDRL